MPGNLALMGSQLPTLLVRLDTSQQTNKKKKTSAWRQKHSVIGFDTVRDLLKQIF